MRWPPVPIVIWVAVPRHRVDEAVGNSHGANSVVDGVGNVDVAGSIHGHPVRLIERGLSGETSVARVASGVVPGDGRDDAGGSRHLANHVVTRVRNVEVAGSIHGHAIADVQGCAGSRAPIARIAVVPGTRHRRDGPARRDFANHVVVSVRDVEIAGAIHRHVRRLIELRLGGRPPVACVAPGPCAGHGRDDAARHRHLPDTAVGDIRDVEVAGGIHRHSPRPVKLGAGGHTAVAGIGRGAVAGYRCDDTRRHLPDPVVRTVRDVDIAPGIHRHAIGLIDLSLHGRPAIAGVALVPVSGDDRDRPIRHLEDYGVARVRNIQIAGSIHRHALGAVELRRGGRAPDHRSDDAAGRDLPDLAVGGVGDVQTPARVHRHAEWFIEQGLRGQSPVAGRAEAFSDPGHRRDDATRQGHLADHVVVRVGDIEIAARVHRHPLRKVEPGAGGRPSVARKARFPSARHLCQYPRPVELEHEVGRAEIHIADGIHRDPRRRRKPQTDRQRGRDRQPAPSRNGRDQVLLRPHGPSGEQQGTPRSNPLVHVSSPPRSLL